MYNHEQYIGQTLQTLADQKRPPDRVVVLDDASTDGSAAIVENFSLPGLELHRNPENLGLFGNWQSCFAYTKDTELFHILLSDDWLTPDFYSEMIKPLASESGFSLAISQCRQVDKQGNILAKKVVAGEVGFRKLSQREFLAQKSEFQFEGVQSYLFRVDGQNPFPPLDPSRPVADYYYFMARTGQAAKAIYSSNSVLSYLRWHPSSFTSGSVGNLQQWVIDEWDIMNEIAAMIPENRISRFIRHQKLRSLFAAKSTVKADLQRKRHPDYAAEIAAFARKTVPLPHYLVGKAAAKIRNCILGYSKYRPEIY